MKGGLSQESEDGSKVENEIWRTVKATGRKEGREAMNREEENIQMMKGEIKKGVQGGEKEEAQWGR